MLWQRYLADTNAQDVTSQAAGKPRRLEGGRLTSASAESSVDVTLRRHTRPYVGIFICLLQQCHY